MIPIAQPSMNEEERDAVLEVLASGALAQGPRVKALEETFARFCGTSYAVAIVNGTAALHTALYALDIQEGDEVITTPFTFVATANAILMQQARLVFADITEDDFNLDPLSVAQKITPRTKAILPVDLYGQPYRVQEINALAKQHGAVIVEDACQAIGATYKNKKTGALGDVGVFSLYATKNIMCGEGGMLVTDNKEAAERAKRFRHHGQDENKRYEYGDLGYNYRMTDLAAAIALVQLKKADSLNEKRRANAQRLNEGLSSLPGIITPTVRENNTHVFHQYTIRITPACPVTRDALANHLKSKEIGCGVYYPKPLHLHPHFMRLGFKPGDFPVAERMAQEVLALPVHPGVTQDNIDYIIKTIQAYAR